MACQARWTNIVYANDAVHIRAQIKTQAKHVYCVRSIQKRRHQPAMWPEIKLCVQ